MKKKKAELTPESVTERFHALVERYHVRQITIDDIQRHIYEVGEVDVQKASHEYFEWVMSMFPEAQSAEEMSEIMQVCSDAWNTFPHKGLGGKAPVDMLNAHKRSKMTKVSEDIIEGFAESIREIYAMVRTRAQLEFRRIGGTSREFAALESALGKRDLEQTAILGNMVAIGRRKNYRGTEWFEPFAREYQAMANHFVLQGEEDVVGSPYLYEVLKTAPEIRQNAAQVFGMIEYTLDTHHSIDECGAGFKLDKRIVSIAHHASDWLMMTRPIDMMLDTPHANALYMYAVTARIQKAVRGEDTDFPEDIFANRIYDDEREIFTERVDELVPILLCEVQDPHMLLVDAESAPDDWFVRLKVIAPLMQDHFGEEMPEGTVPSPFYP